MKGDAEERTHRCKGRRPPRRLLPCSLLEVKRVQRDGERCETTPVKFKLTLPAELVRIFRSNQFELLVAKQSRALKPHKQAHCRQHGLVCGGANGGDAQVPSTRVAAMRRFGTVLYLRAILSMFFDLASCGAAAAGGPLPVAPKQEMRNIKFGRRAFFCSSRALCRYQTSNQ